jgi:hypothetical protein
MRGVAVLGVAAVAVAAGVWAVGGSPATALESGPQVGATVPGPFEPLNLTGPDAGEESCLYCRFGNDPVVMVFARSQSDGLTKLVRAVEKAAAANEAKALRACVVYLDTADSVKVAARKLADAERLRHVILACVKPADVAEYKVAADADVTVLLYDRRTVRANHAFRKGELTAAAVDGVVADLPKILSAK